MLQKQCNRGTSVKVAQKAFFSKEGDKLLEELLWTCEKVGQFYCNVMVYSALTINILNIELSKQPSYNMHIFS